MEVVRLDTEIRRLTALESHHANSPRSLGWDIRDTARSIEWTQTRRAAVLEDAGTARAAWIAAGEKSPGVVIGSKHLQGDGYRKEAAAALETALRPLRRATLERRGEKVEATLGSYLGLSLSATVAANRDEGFFTDLRLVGRERYDVAYNASQPEGTIASLEAQAHPKHLEQLAAGLNADLARLNHRLEGLRQACRPPLFHRLAETPVPTTCVVARGPLWGCRLDHGTPRRRWLGTPSARCSARPRP